LPQAHYCLRDSSVRGGRGTTRPPVFTPTFNAKNFPQSTNINNRYFPLLPGTTYVYEATQGPREHDEFAVTHDIKQILGVDCLVVRDTASINGQVIEDTFDFFAQDKYGNVWYMGEDTKQFKNGVQVGTTGSWQAGVDGALPGFVMEGQPAVGDAYRQENLSGVAEDNAQVLSLTGSVSVPYGNRMISVERIPRAAEIRVIRSVCFQVVICAVVQPTKAQCRSPVNPFGSVD
jgi:hypothetical protein